MISVGFFCATFSRSGIGQNEISIPIPEKI